MYIRMVYIFVLHVCLQEEMLHVTCFPRVCLTDDCDKTVTVHHVIPGAWATRFDNAVLVEIWLGRFRRGHSNTHSMGYDHFMHPRMGEDVRFANPAGVQHWRRRRALLAAKKMERGVDESFSSARIIMFHSECDPKVSKLSWQVLFYYLNFYC
jgi:hypothetical protein